MGLFWTNKSCIFAIGAVVGTVGGQRQVVQAGAYRLVRAIVVLQVAGAPRRFQRDGSGSPVRTTAFQMTAWLS